MINTSFPCQFLFWFRFYWINLQTIEARLLNLCEYNLHTPGLLSGYRKKLG
jgi:hypothetical protein